jgi:hypothetical protein
VLKAPPISSKAAQKKVQERARPILSEKESPLPKAKAQARGPILQDREEAPLPLKRPLLSEKEEPPLPPSRGRMILSDREEVPLPRAP